MSLITTYFDKDSWPKKGVDWLRRAKSAALQGFVIGNQLPPEAEAKAKSLGFSVVPVIEKFNDERDIYCTIAETLEKGQRCLFINSDLSPRGGLSEEKDVNCSLDSTLDLIDIVSSIKSLKQRAKAVRVIQKKVESIHKGLLSTKYILGTWEFWNGFAAFNSYLQEKSYLDRRTACDELAFNLYIALTDSITTEISHD
jgi:hypothetical protein